MNPSHATRFVCKSDYVLSEALFAGCSMSSHHQFMSTLDCSPQDRAPAGKLCNCGDHTICRNWECRTPKGALVPILLSAKQAPKRHEPRSRGQGGGGCTRNKEVNGWSTRMFLAPEARAESTRACGPVTEPLMYDRSKNADLGGLSG